MLSTKIKLLDSICAIDVGNIITIAGYTGSGKSVYAKNLAYSIALVGKHAVYIEVEESPDIVNNCFLKLHNYYNPNINKEDLIKDFDEKIGKNITFIDFTKITFCALKKQLSSIQIEHPIDLIIINSFTILKYKNDVSTLEYLRYFKNIKDTFSSKPNICIITNTSRKGYLYARTRNYISEEDEGTYKIDGIKNWNKLNSFSDYILTVYSTECMRLKKQIKIQILKSKGRELNHKPIVTNFLTDHFFIGDVLTTQ